MTVTILILKQHYGIECIIYLSFCKYFSARLLIPLKWNDYFVLLIKIVNMGKQNSKVIPCCHIEDVWVESGDKVPQQSYNRIVPTEGSLWNWSLLGEQSLLRLFCQRQTLVSPQRLQGLSCSSIINPGEAPSRYSNYSLLKIRRGSGSRLHYSVYELPSWNHLSDFIQCLTNLVHHTNTRLQSSRVNAH